MHSVPYFLNAETWISFKMGTRLQEIATQMKTGQQEVFWFFCLFLNGHNSEKKVPFKGNLCYTSNFKKGKSSTWASPKRKQEILVIEGLVYKIVSTKRDQSARFYSKGSQSAKRFFSKGNQSASVSSKTATSLYNILLCLFFKVFSTKEWCP